MRAWLGFHDISFLYREVQRTNCQAFASASVAAQAYVVRKLHDQRYLSSQACYCHIWKIPILTVAIDMEWLAQLMFIVQLVISSWSSLCLCASITFLNRSVLRSEIWQCPAKGKEASPSASKALVRPKHKPFFVTFGNACVFIVVCSFVNNVKRWFLLWLSTVRSIRKII